MALRSFVSFDLETSNVEEDPTTEESPPGRALADHLAGALGTAGFPLAFPVTEWESYGWEWTVTVNGTHVWLMLQESDPAWLIITDAPRTLVERLKGKSYEPQQRQVCEALHEILHTKLGARDIGWFTRTEMGSGPGAAAP